jgi:hypothetical protein
MAEQRKAVIKNADMSEAMQQDAVDVASVALSKYNIEKVKTLIDLYLYVYIMFILLYSIILLYLLLLLYIEFLLYWTTGCCSIY